MKKYPARLSKLPAIRKFSLIYCRQAFTKSCCNSLNLCVRHSAFSAPLGCPANAVTHWQAWGTMHRSPCAWCVQSIDWKRPIGKGFRDVHHTFRMPPCVTHRAAGFRFIATSSRRHGGCVTAIRRSGCPSPEILLTAVWRGLAQLPRSPPNPCRRSGTFCG